MARANEAANPGRTGDRLQKRAHRNDEQKSIFTKPKRNKRSRMENKTKYPGGFHIADPESEYKDKLAQLAGELIQANPIYANQHPKRRPKLTRSKLVRFLIDNADKVLACDPESLDFSAI
jgi:hypothetical protein